MRVVPFNPLIDKIPNDAVFLFQEEIPVDMGETDEQKAERVIKGSEYQAKPVMFYNLFYQISEESYLELLSNGFFIEDKALKYGQWGSSLMLNKKQ